MHYLKPPTYVEGIEGIRRRFLKLVSLEFESVYPPIINQELLERHICYSPKIRPEYQSRLFLFKILRKNIHDPNILLKFPFNLP